MKKKLIDITKDVDFGLNDDEFLPLTKCKCGQTFETWSFIINCGTDSTRECPNCGRKLCFRPSITVYEVQDE